MHRRSASVAATTLTLLLLTGCTQGGSVSDPSSTDPKPVPTSPASRFATTTPGPLQPNGNPSDVPPAKWDALVADLEGRGVTGEPVLVSAETVTWPNGALGCAKPGHFYTQALIDGMRVVVEVAGATYDYRFGQNDAPVLCER
ncbi:hypothetical protein [Microbacterium hominis]|uniref:Uncharacterized protein n=1 Tax=Microbacterium hominis TaxID=162426 RepID=A0A7D4UIS3_9MICO|nr:hypothetical protein [Microbacterium hominis]QKJ20188.1 hypothetical protein HQM25_13000 [Microbacterium hominis]